MRCLVDGSSVGYVAAGLGAFWVDGMGWDGYPLGVPVPKLLWKLVLSAV